MRVVVIQPPVSIVTYEDAVARLRLDDDVSEKADVEAMIASATAQLDGPDGWLGRAIGLQTLQLRFGVFDGEDVRLPLPPIVDLVSVSWRGADNAVRDGDLADFEVFDDVLVPASGTWAWSGCSIKREAICVRYRAGYEDVPAPIRDAILLMVGSAYRNRDGDAPAVVPAAMSLLAPFRRYT